MEEYRSGGYNKCWYREGHPGEKRSKIIILPQPVGLRGQVAVQDVALFVLETPRDYNEDVAFPYPGPLLDLAFDPAHPLYPVMAADTDMVCSHHQLRAGKLLVQLFFGKTDADKRCPIRIELSCACRVFRFFSMIINYNISGEVY